MLSQFLLISFEAEIAGTSSNAAANSNSSNLFIPPQLRPIIGSNTYNQVQQKLQQQPTTKPTTISHPPILNVPPPNVPPTFIPSFTNDVQPEKSYNSEPTPIVLSSAPKLYTNRLTVNPTVTSAIPQVNGIFQVIS